MTRISSTVRDSFWGSAAFMSGVILVNMLVYLPLPVFDALFAMIGVFILLLLLGTRSVLWFILRQCIVCLAMCSLLLVLPSVISSPPLYSVLCEAVAFVWTSVTLTYLALALSPIQLQVYQSLCIQDLEDRVYENVIKAILSRTSSAPEQSPLWNLKALEKTRIAHLLVPNVYIDEQSGHPQRAFLQVHEDRTQLLRVKARDHLKCCICFGILCQPYILPCGHVFDISCLIQWLTNPSLSKEDPYDIFIVDLFKGCPICRAPLEATPTSMFFLEGLLELFADAQDAADEPRRQPRLRFVPLDTVYPEIARQRALAGARALHFILRDGDPDHPLPNKNLCSNSLIRLNLISYSLVPRQLFRLTKSNENMVTLPLSPRLHLHSILQDCLDFKIGRRVHTGPQTISSPPIPRDHLLATGLGVNSRIYLPMYYRPVFYTPFIANLDVYVNTTLSLFPPLPSAYCAILPPRLVPLRLAHADPRYLFQAIGDVQNGRAVKNLDDQPGHSPSVHGHDPLWFVLGRPLPWYAFRRLVLLASPFFLPSIISSRPFCRVTHRLFGRCLYETISVVWRSLRPVDQLFIVFFLILLDTLCSLRDVMEYTGLQKSRNSSTESTKTETSPSSASQKEVPRRLANVQHENLSLNLQATEGVTAQKRSECSARLKAKEPEDRWTDAKEHLQCSVCLGVLRQPYVTSCGHVFDVGCLLRWFVDAPPFEDMDRQLNPLHRDYFWSRSKTCPLCRTVLKTPPIPLFFLEGLLDLMGVEEVDSDSMGRLKLRPRFWSDMFARERIPPRLDPDQADMLLEDMLAAAREDLRQGALAQGQIIEVEDPPEAEGGRADHPAPVDPEPRPHDGPQRQQPEQERPLLPRDQPEAEPQIGGRQLQPEPVIPPVALPLQPQPQLRRLFLLPRGQPEVEPHLGGPQPQPEAPIRPAVRPEHAVEPQLPQGQQLLGLLRLPRDQPAAEPELALQRAEPERQADAAPELEALQLVELLLFQAEL